jgi:hypothetical protein
MSREFCEESIEVELGSQRDDYSCTEDIVDGSHRTESHRAVVYWGGFVDDVTAPGRTWCEATIEADMDGTPEDLRCGEDIIDGVHRTDTHQAVYYWGSPS